MGFAAPGLGCAVTGLATLRPAWLRPTGLVVFHRPAVPALACLRRPAWVRRTGHGWPCTTRASGVRSPGLLDDGPAGLLDGGPALTPGPRGKPPPPRTRSAATWGLS